MRNFKAVWIAALATLASLALLIPAGSAQAAYGSAPFCGSVNPGGGYSPMTLKTGQVCGFYPVAVRYAIATWDVVKSGSGSICLGVLQYPPGWPNGKPLSPTGSGPGNYWNCFPVNGWDKYAVWGANNPFGAVYGQPVLLNYSSATIKTRLISGGWYSHIEYYY
jgi:hypothetical protein